MVETENTGFYGFDLFCFFKKISCKLLPQNNNWNNNEEYLLFYFWFVQLLYFIKFLQNDVFVMESDCNTAMKKKCRQKKQTK